MGWMFYLNALCTAKQSLQYIFDDDVHCDRFWDVLIFSLKVCAKISPIWVEVTWNVVLVIQEESVANTHFCKGASRVGRTFTLLLQCWTGSDGLLFWYLFCGKQNICLSRYKQFTTYQRLVRILLWNHWSSVMWGFVGNSFRDAVKGYWVKLVWSGPSLWLCKCKFEPW